MSESVAGHAGHATVADWPLDAQFGRATPGKMEDLYRVIASGVGGTAMPTWKGSLPEEDIWALAHYVESLVAMRDRPEAAELRRHNQMADASWTPPPPPAAK